MISPARRVAHSVLMRVEDGAYASDLLLYCAAQLDSRNAGLTHEIVMGTLRRQAQLDYLISQNTRRAAAKLDAEVRVALRMGIYQLRHLDRVPSHAAVNESVALVKAAKKTSAAGLVNATLRRVSKEPADWPSREIALSMPEWLLGGWEHQYGVDVTLGIANCFLKAPDTYVRNPPLDRPGLEATDVPGAYRVVSGGSSGLRVQDIGSQSIVPLLELQPGMTFLDVCAAPGNKTAQALEKGVKAVACDIHLRRLQTVEGCARVVLDGGQPLPFRRKFDRILIDAPCSGTGTLGRNPEIRWRLQPNDVEALHRKQVGILRQGLSALAPSGILVYSTCSLQRRENEEVVEQVGMPAAYYRRIPGVDAGDGFFAAVLRSR